MDTSSWCLSAAAHLPSLRKALHDLVLKQTNERKLSKRWRLVFYRQEVPKKPLTYYSCNVQTASYGLSFLKITCVNICQIHIFGCSTFPDRGKVFSWLCIPEKSSNSHRDLLREQQRGKGSVTRPSVEIPQVIIVFNKLFLAQAVSQHTSSHIPFLLAIESGSCYWEQESDWQKIALGLQSKVSSPLSLFLADVSLTPS